MVLRVPKELLAGDYPLIIGTKHRFDVWEDLWRASGADWAGPVELAVNHSEYQASVTLGGETTAELLADLRADG